MKKVENRKGNQQVQQRQLQGREMEQTEVTHELFSIKVGNLTIHLLMVIIVYIEQVHSVSWFFNTVSQSHLLKLLK